MPLRRRCNRWRRLRSPWRGHYDCLRLAVLLLAVHQQPFVQFQFLHRLVFLSFEPRVLSYPARSQLLLLTSISTIAPPSTTCKEAAAWHYAIANAKNAKTMKSN